MVQIHWKTHVGLKIFKSRWSSGSVKYEVRKRRGELTTSHPQILSLRTCLAYVPKPFGKLSEAFWQTKKRSRLGNRVRRRLRTLRGCRRPSRSAGELFGERFGCHFGIDGLPCAIVWDTKLPAEPKYVRTLILALLGNRLGSRFKCCLHQNQCRCLLHTAGCRRKRHGSDAVRKKKRLESSW